MIFKRITALFCIFALTVFQLAVVTSFADCCCTIHKEAQQPEATESSSKHSCCAVKPDQKEAAPSPSSIRECLSPQKEMNLCACDHQHIPIQVDERQVVIPNKTKQEQFVSIRLVPVKLPFLLNADTHQISTPQLSLHFTTVLMQTVVLRI